MDLIERMSALLIATARNHVWPQCQKLLRADVTHDVFWSLISPAITHYSNGMSSEEEILIPQYEGEIKLAMSLWEDGLIKELRHTASGAVMVGANMDRMASILETAILFGELSGRFGMSDASICVAILQSRIGGAPRVHKIRDVTRSRLERFTEHEVRKAASSLVYSGMLSIPDIDANRIVLSDVVTDMITTTIASFYETPKESET